MFYKHNKLIFNSIITMLFLIVASYSIADIHIVKEEKSTYRDLARGYSFEIWLCKDKGYRKMNDRIAIARYDLNKRWDIDLKEGTYTERQLDSKPPESPPQKEKLHNEGFNYEPEYDWVVKETKEEKVICGIKCRKFIFDGDADYAEKIVELWIADDLGIDIGDYGERFDNNLHSYEYGELLKLSDTLKDSFILYAKEIEEHFIAPQRISESQILKLEDISPPEGIYELPEGFKKIEPAKEQMR